LEGVAARIAGWRCPLSTVPHYCPRCQALHEIDAARAEVAAQKALNLIYWSMGLSTLSVLTCGLALPVAALVIGLLLLELAKALPCPSCGARLRPRLVR
jgi:hypothetical protein